MLSAASARRDVVRRCRYTWSSGRGIDRIFDANAVGRLGEIFENVCRDFEASLIEFNGETDHVHLLVNYLLRRVCWAALGSPSYASISRTSEPRAKTRFLRGLKAGVSTGT